MTQTATGSAQPDPESTATVQPYGPAQPPDDSPIGKALSEIDTVSMDFRTLASGDREAEQSPALTRLSDAVSRLANVIRIPNDRKSDELWRYFDPGVVRSFANNARAIVSSWRSDRWDAAVAFDLALTIDEYIVERAGVYTRTDANNSGEFIDRVYTMLNRASDAQRATLLDKRLSEQLARVDVIVGNVKQAAGVVAEGKLSEAFKEYSTSEMSGANLYRRFAIGVLVAVAGFSIYTAISLPSSLGSSLAHLSIGLSSLTIFGYLARESAQHRKAARWASVLSVQLRTLDAYSADMTAEQREILREHFGRRVFAEPTSALDGQEAKNGDVASLLQAAIDLVKVARGH